MGVLGARFLARRLISQAPCKLLLAPEEYRPIGFALAREVLKLYAGTLRAWGTHANW